MLIYWLLFLIPAWLAVSRHKLSPGEQKDVWKLLGIVLVLLIGFRHEVGGDWLTYGFVYTDIEKLSLTELINTFGQSQGDVGYNAINWFSAQLGWGMYGVNLICAILFTIGLIKFCRAQPLPLLALTCAIPYLVTIVGMGYTRQGVAIGLVMAALVYLSSERIKNFIVLVLLAALFHKTAIALIPLAMLARAKMKVGFFVWSTLLIGILVFLFREKAQFLIKHYVEETFYQSEGTGIRLAMNFIPALLFLLFRKGFSYSPTEEKLWTWLSMASLILPVLFLIAPDLSTPIDRMALYLIPIQLMVFSRLPYLAKNSSDGQAVINLTVIYYGVVLFVWLNFAQTAFAWIPYQFYPWTIL